MARTGTTSGPAGSAAALADRPPFSTALGLTRYLTACGLAGLFTGVVVGGVGGRLFMRFAGAAAGARAAGATTEAGFTVGEITTDGTFSLLLFVGIFTGIVGATYFVVLRPWLAGAGAWRGVAFGIVLFAVGSATSDVLNPDNVDFVILGNEILVLTMIVALFIGFGALIEPLFRWFDRRLPEASTSHRVAIGVYSVIAALGILIGTAFLFQAMFTRSLCDCDPPIVASVFLGIAGLGTLAWAASAFSNAAVLPKVARFLGIVGVAGATVAGLTRAIGDATAILRG